MAVYTVSILIMLMFSIVTSENMSIIRYDQEHHTKGGEWRTNEEIMALYESWLVENKKVYNALGEKDKRFLVFKDNLKYIDEVNTKTKKTYKLGLTKFADLTNEEYKSMYLGTTSEDSHILSNITQSDRYAPKVGDSCLPCFVDWRKKGAIVGIKDQKGCGSCWAFATVSSIEAINQIVTGQLVSLSEQQVIDCDTYSQGCKSGSVHRAFEFVINNGGIDIEVNYPYTERAGTCNGNALKYVTINGYERVPSYNEMALKKAVANQPVAAIVDSSSKDFQHYKSGIFTGSCGTNVDHAVLVVGYGVSEDGMDFWIVRNSWGANWGEGGYIKMQRNIDNTAGLCGITMFSYYPIKTGPNPPNICKHGAIVWCAVGYTCCSTASESFCCTTTQDACCKSYPSCCSNDLPASNVQMGTCSTSKAPMKGILSNPSQIYEGNVEINNQMH